MKNFVYSLPTQIHFGVGAENQLGDVLVSMEKRRILLICDAFLKDGPLLDRVETSLREKHLFYIVQADVLPNPVMSDVRARIKTAVENEVDFVVAVGGGSSIDTAKAVALGACDPSVDVADYFRGKKHITKTLGCGVILTIAATGSENSLSCMVTFDEDDVQAKGAIANPIIRPKFALMNPENTYTLPKYQVACGVADIMMHTMDRYFTNTDGNELTDQIAEAIIRVAMENGAVAVKDSHDYNAMSELMWCGSLSHNGITNAGRPMDFSVHQLGNIFSGVFRRVPHGAVVAVLWPAWATYVYKKDCARFARLARKVFGVVCEDDEEAALAGISAAKNYFVNVLGIPGTLGEIGVDTSDEMLLAIAKTNTHDDERTLGNFVPLTTKDAFQIYKVACQK